MQWDICVTIQGVEGRENVILTIPSKGEAMSNRQQQKATGLAL